MILTRPEPQSRRFARALRAAGVATPILFSPVLEIVPLALDSPVSGRVPIFTSENGVATAVATGLVRPGLSGIAVGDRTAAVAAAAGIECRVGAGGAEGIATLIARERIAGPFVHIHGRHVAGDLAGRLRDAGHDVAALAIYDQIARPLSAAACAACARRDVVLPLFSARSAALVAEALPARPARIRIAAMSAAVAAAWPWSDPVAIAARPTATALVAELRRLVATGSDR